MKDLYFKVETFRQAYEELKIREQKGQVRDVPERSNYWIKLSKEEPKDERWLVKCLIARFIDYGMKSEKAGRILLEMEKENLMDVNEIIRREQDLKKLFKRLSVERSFRGKSRRKGPEEVANDLLRLVKHLKEHFNGNLNHLREAVKSEINALKQELGEHELKKVSTLLLLLELSAFPSFGQKQSSLFLREVVDAGLWSDVVDRESLPISLDTHLRQYFKRLAENVKFPKESIEDWQILTMAEIMAIINRIQMADLDYKIWITERQKTKNPKNARNYLDSPLTL